MTTRTSSLKEALVAQEAFVGERDCYVERMELAEADPIKYEIFYSRLLSTVQNARETATRVSASLNVQTGEFVLALYTIEGDLVVHSTGIFAHVNTMSRCIKWMIRNDYEETVGFNDGDYFANNDPFVGGLHVPDVMDIAPFYYQGRLIGWIGGVTHVREVGAVEPSSMPVSAVTRFHEGKILAPLKVAENDTLRRDYEIWIERGTRNPIYWLMDEKARIAGVRIIRDAVRQIIDEVGLDYYLKAGREIIEEGRRKLRTKVRQVCFPGRYRSAAFYDVLFKDRMEIMPGADHDTLIHFPLELAVTRDGKLRLDFEGASRWGLHPQNTTIAGMEGGLFICMCQLLAHDGKMNAGNVIGCELRVPYGSWGNPDNIFAATSTTWRPLMTAYGNLFRVLSYAFYARGYREEVLVGPSNSGYVQGGGIDQYGKPFGGLPITSGGALGCGARGVMDGIDAGYIMWNPETDSTDVDLGEQRVPALCLGKSMTCDTGGFGKYRGGNSSDWVMLFDSDDLEMGSMGFGYKVLDQPGIMGGYPGSGRYLNIARGTNVADLIERRQPLPHREGPDPANPEMRQLVEADQWELGISGGYPSRPFRRFDLLEDVNASGGGLGDPIDRDPELVRQDLERGWTSGRVAEGVYGVMTDAGGSVDAEATRRSRAGIRAARRARAVPAAEYRRRHRERVLQRRFCPEVLQMYRESCELSPAWAAEYRAFWELPDDFTLA